MSTVIERRNKLQRRKALNPFVRPPFPVRRWTVKEYERLTRLGMLSTDDRVELLEGWIVPKMTQLPPHMWAVLNVGRVVAPLLGTEWHLRCQMAVKSSDSLPEPDQAVARGSLERYLDRIPTKGDLPLVIEVADTTLRKDRQKSRIYASIGVPVYWIINLLDRQIEVYSSPAARNRKYKERRILTVSDRIALAIDGRTLGEFKVEEFLPPPDTPILMESE